MKRKTNSTDEDGHRSLPREVAIAFAAASRRVQRGDLIAFAATARKAAGVKGRVDVLITSSAEMRAMNRRFRRKDKPTDVLSFPAANANGVAGDIAICAEIAAENAERFGHALSEELKILILHGMLHLAGHDHEDDDGEMARIESRLRAKLGLRDSLTERAALRARKGKAPVKRRSGAR